jgi:predicted LPLAT superfamily acyltransferase
MYEKLKCKQGGILLTAHLGNTEAMQALSEFNELLKLNVLVHTQHAEQFNRVLLKQTTDHTIRLLNADDINPAVAADLSRRVADGEWVVIAADRIPLHSKRTIPVNFLGTTAHLPAGPHILALLLECPLVFTTCLKQEDGLHIYFELLSERLVAQRNLRDACFQQSAQNYADTLARYCKIAPLQWGNFFPIWADLKDNPP